MDLSAIGLAVLFSLTLAPAAEAQVRIDNGTVTRHNGAAGLARTFQPLVKAANDPYWIAYAVPVVDGDRVMCCWSSSRAANSGCLARGSDLRW